MKKTISLILCVLIAASMLTACTDVKTTQETLKQVSDYANSPEGTKVLEELFSTVSEVAAADNPTVGENKAEDPKAEEPKAEDLKTEQAKEEGPKAGAAEPDSSPIGEEDRIVIDQIVEYFMPLTRIPRQSGYEEEVSEYLFNWAKERGFNPEKDEENNIIFDVPATAGMEKAPITILQGHMDMVIAVAEGKTFDPQKDGITVLNDGIVLKADGTSLGADDGMGIATALYIVEKNKSHGPLRIIFTTNEEDGMDGANALTEETVAGAKYVINIDSENSTEVTNSSAASVIVEFINKLETTSPAKKKAMELTISGLQGGHSGIDIDKFRINGIKAIAGLLNFMDFYEIDFEMACLEGGSANNAIPTKASTKIVYDPADEDEIKEAVDCYKNILSMIFDGIETEFELKTKECAVPDKVLTSKAQGNLLAFVTNIHDGVFTMSKIVDGLVESSSNLGLLSMNPEKSETGTASTYVRSSDADKLKTLVDGQLKQAENCGIEAEALQRAEPWPVNSDSKLVKLIQEAYFQETGTDISVVQIHAGLETGVFAKLNPKLDIVSVGLDIKNPHTINETCYLATLPTVCRMLERVLSEIGSESN